MKILHVLYSGLGGHGNVFFSMVKADKDHEFAYEALFNGIEDVRDEYINKCNALHIQWNFIKKKPGIDLTYIKSTARIIQKSNADIVFLHSSAYVIFARLANLLSRKKKKIIIRETQANNLKRKRDWAALGMAFLVADRIVFLSEEYKNEVQKKLGAVYNKAKVAVIPNGIDLNIFYPGPKDNSPNIIGMQSRLTYNKDHTTLLKAIALLKKEGYDAAGLKIAGDGECMEELVVLSQQLNIAGNVEFTGMLGENDLVNFLHRINIYVHASLGETMSTAIMQAMACGLPVIASDVPGINNMISNDTTGILVPVKNAQALADAIRRLVNDKAFAERLGENAYNFAKENYSGLTMFKKYKQLFTR